jgi:hypothetical protein
MRRMSIVGLAVLLGGIGLDAQTRALVTTVLPAPGAPLSAARDLVINLDTPALEATLPGAIDGNHPNQGHRATLSADGRFFVGPYMRLPITIPPVYPLAIRDLVTGATASVRTDVWWTASNPRRPQVVMALTGGDVGVIDAAGVRTRPACAPSIPSAVAVARDGGEFYVACSNVLLVLDATSGAERRRFTLPSSVRDMHVVAGNRLFTLDYAGPVTFAVMEMSIYDLATGTRLANAPTPVAGRGLTWAVPSPDGSTVVVGVGATAGTGPATPHVVDSLTAAVLGTWPVDQVTRLAFLASGTRAMMLRETPAATSIELHGVLLDAATATVVAQAPLGTAAFTDTSNLVLLEPPLAPETLTAAVTGRDVTLQWTEAATSGLATDIVLEAGTTPTAADLLTTHLGSNAPSIVVTNVPPGRYYVRVRAMNAVGTGPPSPTIDVLVP